jgi:predicted phage terminase large subunit-like protein
VRITTEHHEKHVLDWYERYGLQALHVEDRTFGTNLIRRLIGVPGVVVQKLKADTSKVIRALPVQYEVLNGMLWFPRDAEWLQEFESELTKFPNTTHDDQVDALGYAVQVYKNLPPWIERKRDPVTPEEKAQAHIAELAGRNRRGRKRLPGVGRW